MDERRWRVIGALPRIERWWLMCRFGTEALHKAPGCPATLFLHSKFRQVSSLGFHAFGTRNQKRPGLARFEH